MVIIFSFLNIHFDGNSGMINHSMIIGMPIDEFAEDSAQLIRGHNKANPRKINIH
jgi:hypothetical protein